MVYLDFHYIVPRFPKWASGLLLDPPFQHFFYQLSKRDPRRLGGFGKQALRGKAYSSRGVDLDDIRKAAFHDEIGSRETSQLKISMSPQRDFLSAPLGIAVHRRRKRNLLRFSRILIFIIEPTTCRRHDFQYRKCLPEDHPYRDFHSFK